MDGIVREKSVYHQALLVAGRQSEKPQEINTLLGSALSLEAPHSKFTVQLNSINAAPYI